MKAIEKAGSATLMKLKTTDIKILKDTITEKYGAIVVARQKFSPSKIDTPGVHTSEELDPREEACLNAVVQAHATYKEGHILGKLMKHKTDEDTLKAISNKEVAALKEHLIWKDKTDLTAHIHKSLLIMLEKAAKREPLE